MNQKYKFAIVFLAVGLLLGSFITYSFSQGSSTFTLTSGIYPGAPSYTVWKEGSSYYAKNQYGSLAYSGTNASAVVNAILTATSGNIEIRFSEGTYIISAAITLGIDDDGVSFEGEGYGESTTLQCGADNEILFNAVGTTANRIEYVSFSNLRLDGGGYDNTTGIYSYKGTGWVLSNIQFYRFYFHAFIGAESWDFRTWNTWTKTCGSQSLNTTAWYLTDSTDSSVATFHITNSQFEGNPNGDIEMYAPQAHKIFGVKLSNIKFHAVAEPERLTQIKPSILMGGAAANTGGSFIQMENIEFENYKSSGAIYIYRGSNVQISNVGFWQVGNSTSDCYLIKLWTSSYVTVTNINGYGNYGRVFDEAATSSNDIVIGNNCKDGDTGGIGINALGSNTYVNLCWNGTTWIP